MNNKELKNLISKISKTSTLTKDELNKLTTKQKKYIFKKLNFILTL